MKRLRELRRAANMSQAQMGKVLNLCQQQISSIERGTVSATEEVIIKVAEYFAVPTDYLLEIKRETAAEEILNEKGVYQADSFEEQVLEYMKRVPNSGKKMMLDLVKAVYDNYNI